MVECADCKLVSLGFNSLNVLFDLEFILYILDIIYFIDSNISLSRFTTDCCVIGNVSTLGVGIWGFKSLQSDRFFTYFYTLYLNIYFIISYYYYYNIYNIYMPAEGIPPLSGAYLYIKIFQFIRITYVLLLVFIIFTFYYYYATISTFLLP